MNDPRRIVLAIVALSLTCAIEACSPGQKEAIDKLATNLGIVPADNTGDLLNNNRFGESPFFVEDASELNCDFQKPETCAWTNMDNTTNPNIDIEDFFLFEKSDKKMFPGALGPSGVTRTPKQGDRFILSGGAKESQTYATYYSKPLKCMTRGGSLAFSYFLYKNTKVRVFVLDPATFEPKWQSDPSQCTKFTPSDGICNVTIPAQKDPFHLAIQALDFDESLVIVDNIKFKSHLGFECGKDIFNFGSQHTAYESGATGNAITKASDLNCNEFQGCRYENENGLFDVHNGVTNTEQWRKITGHSEVPDGNFLMAKRSDGFAVFKADQIECQDGDGTLRFRAWKSQGTNLRVCVVDANSKAPPSQCYPISDDTTSAPTHEVAITGPLKKKQLVFVADNWNNGKGGMVAIDDITYTAALCVDFGTTASELKSGATGKPIDSSDDLDCDNWENCRWKNTGSGAAWETHNGNVDADKWREVTGSGVTPDAPFLMVFPTEDGPSVLSSDPIDCQADDGVVKFMLWSSTNTDVKVCATSIASNEQLHCQPLEQSPNPERSVTIPGYITKFRIDVIAEMGGDDGVAMAAIDDLKYDAPLCLDVGSTGKRLDGSGRTGEPIHKSEDLDCINDINKCRWGNGGQDSDQEQADWLIHEARELDTNKWQTVTGSSIMPDGQFLMTNPKPGVNPSMFVSDPVECQSEDGALSFDLWRSSAVDVMICAVDADDMTTTLFCDPMPQPNAGDRPMVIIPGPIKNFVITITAMNLGSTPQMVAIDNIEYIAHLCSDLGDTKISKLTSSATGEPIETASDLNCNGFENCRWTDENNVGEPWQKHTGSVDTQKWEQLFGKSGAYPGNNFLVVYPSDTAPSTLDSDPIECQAGDGVVKLRAWSSSPSVTLNVCVLDADTNKVRSCVPVPNINDNTTPDRTVVIPGSQQNFKLQIRVESDGPVDKDKAFAIDRFEYEAVMCDETQSDFGTTSSELTGGGTNPEPVRESNELNCDEFDGCRWSNQGNGPQWRVHEGNVDAEEWKRVTGSSETPDGRFLMVHGKSGEAVLASDVVPCQEGEGVLTFRAWMSPGMQMEVCVVSAEPEEEPVNLQDCVPVTRDSNPVKTVIIHPPSDVPFQIQIIAKGWNNGLGGMAALDDIVYDADVCPPAQPKGTEEECESVQCDFEASEDCRYILNGHEGDGVELVNEGDGPTFDVVTGRFENRVTGIHGASNGDYYLAVLLHDGEHAAISVGTNLTYDRVITFRHYEATAKMQFKICCDDDCPYASDGDVKVSDRGLWAHSRILCPAGTKKMQFECVNFKGSQNQGACGIDHIQLWRTREDYEFDPIVGVKDISVEDLTEGLIPACKKQFLARRIK